MGNLKQAGKILRENKEEASHNVRRYSENFPQVERTVDNVGPVQSYKKDFHTSGFRHTVKMNVNIKELQKPCELAPIDLLVSADVRCGNVGAIYPAPHAGPDGTAYPLYYDNEGFTTNIGGWSFGGSGGIVVPVSGVYQIHAVNSIGGVSGTAPPAYVTGTIRRNGGVLTSATYTAVCAGLCGFGADFNLYATAYLAAGDTVGMWLEAGGNFFFYTPTNLCGLFGDQGLFVTLVAQP